MYVVEERKNSTPKVNAICKKGNKNMARFTEIEKVNSYGEKGKALVDLDNLVGMKEIHVEPVKLYDEEGNLVSETPKPKE